MIKSKATERLKIQLIQKAVSGLRRRQRTGEYVIDPEAKCGPFNRIALRLIRDGAVACPCCLTFQHRKKR